MLFSFDSFDYVLHVKLFVLEFVRNLLFNLQLVSDKHVNLLMVALQQKIMCTFLISDFVCSRSLVNVDAFLSELYYSVALMILAAKSVACAERHVEGLY